VKELINQSIRSSMFQFLFCNSSFAPSPDALIADLAQTFNLDGNLVVNYCQTPAWG
jgi:ubiquitin-like protein ATG12